MPVKKENTRNKKTKSTIAQTECKGRCQIFKRALDVAITGSIVFDTKGKVIFINSYITDILKYKPKELLSKKFTSIVPKEEKEQVVPLPTVIKKLKKQSVLESHIIISDKKKQLHRFQIVYRKQKQDTSYIIIASVVDITKQWELQKVLQETNNNLETFVNSLHEGVLIYNEKGVIIYANVSATQILAVSKKELIGKKWLDASWKFIREDETPFPREKCPMQKSQETGKSQTNVIMGIYRKKGLIWIEINTTVYNVEGKKHIATVFRNITKELIVQKEIDQEKQKFEKAFNNSPIGMAIVSLEGTWIDVNKKIEQTLGYSKKELMKKTFQDVTYKDDLQKDLNLMQETIGGKRDTYEIEKRYIHKNKSIICTNS